MENSLTILLIEDEPKECLAMIEYMEKAAGVQLLGVTNNAEKALEYVTDMLPDAIILDLELHKGQGNGLSFLRDLQKMPERYQGYVLVTTNNVSQITHKSARNMGADFIMLKTQEDYSAGQVVDFLVSLKTVIHAGKKAAADSAPKDTAYQKQQRMACRISTELNHVCIPQSATGRKYLIEGILHTIRALDATQEKKATAYIADHYGKSQASVERAMQNAIEKAWSTSAIEDLEHYYTARIRSERGVPSILEFIHYYAEKVKNAYER